MSYEIFVICAAVGAAFFLSYAFMTIELKKQDRIFREYRQEQARAVSLRDEYIRRITGVIDHHAGGIDERISGGVKIMDAIHDHAPELPRLCSGLISWLDANDKFLRKLKYTVQEELEFSNEDSHDQDKASREVIERLFARAASRPIGATGGATNDA